MRPRRSSILLLYAGHVPSADVGKKPAGGFEGSPLGTRNAVNSRASLNECHVMRIDPRESEKPRPRFILALHMPKDRLERGVGGVGGVVTSRA